MASNLETVRSFVASWAARDIDAILAAMTQDCFYHNMPWPPQTRISVRRVLRSLARMFGLGLQMYVSAARCSRVRRTLTVRRENSEALWIIRLRGEGSSGSTPAMGSHVKGGTGRMSQPWGWCTLRFWARMARC